MELYLLSKYCHKISDKIINRITKHIKTRLFDKNKSKTNLITLLSSETKALRSLLVSSTTCIRKSQRV